MKTKIARLLDALKLDAVVQEAQDAFWAVIAKHHPECKSGDISPGSVLAFDSACYLVVDTWLDANQPKGRLLEIEPDIDAIAETHWDCWADDGNPENPQYEWDDQKSISAAYLHLIHWSEDLSIPGIHPIALCGSLSSRVFGAWYLSKGQHNEGYANAFRDVIDKIIEAGYSVYVSDTRLEIYRTEEL